MKNHKQPRAHLYDWSVPSQGQPSDWREYNGWQRGIFRQKENCLLRVFQQAKVCLKLTNQSFCRSLVCLNETETKSSCRNLHQSERQCYSFMIKSKLRCSIVHEPANIHNKHTTGTQEYSQLDTYGLWLVHIWSVTSRPETKDKSHNWTGHKWTESLYHINNLVKSPLHLITRKYVGDTSLSNQIKSNQPMNFYHCQVQLFAQGNMRTRFAAICYSCHCINLKVQCWLTLAWLRDVIWSLVISSVVQARNVRIIASLWCLIPSGWWRRDCCWRASTGQNNHTAPTHLNQGREAFLPVRDWTARLISSAFSFQGFHRTALLFGNAMFCQVRTPDRTSKTVFVTWNPTPCQEFSIRSVLSAKNRPASDACWRKALKQILPPEVGHFCQTWTFWETKRDSDKCDSSLSAVSLGGGGSRQGGTGWTVLCPEWVEENYYFLLRTRDGFWGYVWMNASHHWSATMLNRRDGWNLSRLTAFYHSLLMNNSINMLLNCSFKVLSNIKRSPAVSDNLIFTSHYWIRSLGENGSLCETIAAHGAVFHIYLFSLRFGRRKPRRKSGHRAIMEIISTDDIVTCTINIFDICRRGMLSCRQTNKNS